MVFPWFTRTHPPLASTLRACRRLRSVAANGESRAPRKDPGHPRRWTTPTHRPSKGETKKRRKFVEKNVNYIKDGKLYELYELVWTIQIEHIWTYMGTIEGKIMGNIYFYDGNGKIMGNYGQKN